VAVLNQHIFRVEPDESKIDKLYLRFALARVLDDIERHLHGATMKHVNKGDLLSAKIFTPSLVDRSSSPCRSSSRLIT
jgi:type I restriction enzyme S subunit